MLSTSVILLFSSIEQKINASKSPGSGNELLSSERIAGNKIPCQDEENNVDDLVIANLDEQSIVQTPFLTFVPDEQIAEVTVQARTKWKIKQKKTPQEEKKRAKKKTKKIIPLKIKK